LSKRKILISISIINQKRRARATFTVIGITPRILINMSCFKANIAPNKPTVGKNNRMILCVRNSRKGHIFVLYLELWTYKSDNFEDFQLTF